MEYSDLLLCCRGYMAKHNHYNYPEERKNEVFTEEHKRKIMNKVKK